MKNLSLVEAFLHETVDNKSTLEMSDMLQKILNSKDSTQQSKTVLHKASEQGDLSKVEFLIQLGAQVDAIDEDQATPLHYANSFEVVNCLVNNGANVEAKDIDGQTPLYYADSAIGITAFIANGAQINIKDINGKTPMHYFANEARIEAFECLLENGAEIDAKDFRGSTPLHYAVIEGNFEIVKLLIDHGAQVDAKNHENETPFDLACKEMDHAEELIGKDDTLISNFMKISKYLLEKKRDSDDKMPQENASNKALCIICSYPRNGLFVLVPCGHMSLCEPCCFDLKKQKYSKCPSCRKPIKNYTKAFFQEA